MNKHKTHYELPLCVCGEWYEEHMLCSSDVVETEDFNDLTDYEW